MNPTERKIIGVVAYGIALLAITLLFIFLGDHSATPIFAILAVPLILVSLSLKLKGGLLLGVATALAGTPFLITQNDHLLLVGGLFIMGIIVGGGIGLINELREARRKRWGRSKNFEERYDEEIFENSLNIIHFIDKEGTVLKRNEASRSTLGHVTKRSLQISEYVHPNDIDRMKAELLRLFERGEVRDINLRFISQAHNGISVELRATRATERLAVMEARDLRQQMELERRLNETEAIYRYLIEDAVDTLDSGIIITGKRKQVVWANKMIGQFFGVDRERLIGIENLRAFARYSNVFDDSEQMSQVVKEAIDNGSKIDSYTCRIRPSIDRDERVLEYRSIPIETERYKGGRIDHYIDITKVKKLEAGLLENAERLERSYEKLEEFSHHVSHDLRHPLRTVRMFSQFLLEDYESKLDGKGVEYLHTLTQTSARMSELIDDLLSLSSIHMNTTSFERVNVQQVLGEIKEDLHVSLHGVNLQIANDLPTVKGSRSRIYRLFSNLIVNAIKYNDKALPTLHVGWVKESRQDGMHTFYVKDNGIGIERRHHEHIFGMFEKLNQKKDSEGTGAGLAICKRIVEEHKGKIWVESEVGKGSTFYFIMPREDARSEVEING
ncbi:MAG: ATP-binding protein [Candidatus Bipolaricaulota bacterium]|nr:ATP-binding protein [Candidatus Bipolaricaulota bacterium]